MLSARCGRVVRRSSDYYSMPVGYVSEWEYLNICIALVTDMSLPDLLLATQEIERALGRTVKNRYADRTIDIDIVCAEDESGRAVTVKTDTLTVPHPKMQDRPFVMIPLAEIR